jgi:hypothetical protein
MPSTLILSRHRQPLLGTSNAQLMQERLAYQQSSSETIESYERRYSLMNEDIFQAKFKSISSIKLQNSAMTLIIAIKNLTEKNIKLNVISDVSCN